MLFLRKITSSFTVFVITAMMAQSALAADNGKFDIVGLKLGMTLEQAMEALRTHGVDEQSITERRMYYHYSDGIKHNYKTEEFLHSLTASKKEIVNAGKRQSDSISLVFSPPPLGGRVVVVRRTLKNEIDAVTGGQFRDALTSKYGPPQATSFAALNWKFGGTQNCISNDTKGMGISLPSPSRNQSILDLVYANSGTGYLLDRFRIGRVKSLDDCANMLEYTIAAQGDMPASSVQAAMIDVQSWVKAELAAGEEVEKLRKAAVEKRVGGGKKPTL